MEEVLPASYDHHSAGLQRGCHGRKLLEPIFPGLPKNWRGDCSVVPSMSSDRSSEAFDAGNRVFHEAYGGARDSVRRQGPVLVVMPTELALHHRNQRLVVCYSRPSFVRAKSAAHIAVALFALTQPDAQEESQRTGLARLLAHIQVALGETHPDREPVDREIRALLQCCLHFARAASEQAGSEVQRAKFASDAGPRILHITELATREQIAGLDQATESVFSRLSPDEQAELQVVVVGDHQARARSLGMQYFKRRFRELPGADQRVTYGENIEDEEEAISLVATRRLDKQIAQAFFADENRLQRDVLGDAAKRCLDEMAFPPERLADDGANTRS
jgi:hypothetical protein